MRRCVLLIVPLIAVGLGVLKFAGAQPEKAGPEAKQERVDHQGDPLPEGALARIGTTRFRHGGKELLGFTLDKKSLMYVGGGAIHLMDVATGKETAAVKYGNADQRGFGGMAIFGGMGPSVILSGDTKVMAVISHLDPNGVNGATVTVVDTATGKERKRFGPNDLVKNGGQFFQPGLALTDDGKWLLVHGGNGNVGRAFGVAGGGGQNPLLWVDTTTGQRVHEIASEKGCRFGHAQFSRDGRNVVVVEFNDGNGSARLRIIDAVRGTDVRSVDFPANNNKGGGDRIQSFELRPDGKTILATNSQGGPGGPASVQLFDYSAGKEIKEVRNFADATGRGSFVMSRDGQQLFVAGMGKVHLWDIDTGKEVRQIDAPNLSRVDPNIFPGGFAITNSLAVSSDGKLLAASGRQSFSICDVDTGKLLAGGSSGAAIGVVHFTPSGKGLIVSNSEYLVQEWNSTAAKLIRTMDRPDNMSAGPRGFDFTGMLVGSAGFSSDGKLLAVGLGQGGVALWDAATGKFKKRYGAEDEKDNNLGPERLPTSFAFSPRNNMLATGMANGSIKLWDAGTGQGLRSWAWSGGGRADNPLGMVQQQAMMALAFSPDGKTLAGGGMVNTNFDGTMPGIVLALWETATGKERLRLQTNSASFGSDPGGFGFDMIFALFDQMVLSMNFSPDGKSLAIGTFSGMHIVDAFTGKDIATYSGRMMFGRTAVFSPDGKRLFFGRADGKLRVLDVSTGRLVRDFPGHTEPIMSLALSPDGKTLASGSNDSTVLLWDVAELVKPVSPVQVTVTAKDLEQLWSDLADDDAVKAYQAINLLASVPADAVPFFKARLKTVTPVDPKLLEKLLEDLNSQKFAVRDKATADLEKLGDLAKPILREQLAGKPPLEVRQRMEKLLGKLNGPVQTPQIIQAMRAIEALERIGNREALELLLELAKGARGHRLTEDAHDAVERLELHRAGEKQ